jgi:hypothetical protein
MKIRTGFVSNSSSASFIVDWRCKLNGGSKIGFALHKLFDYWDLKYEGETDQISIDERYNKESSQTIEELKIQELESELGNPHSSCADCDSKCENQTSGLLPDEEKQELPPVFDPEDQDVEGEDFLNALRQIKRDSPPPEPIYDKGSTKEKIQFVNHIISNTIDNGDGRFATRFFTCMLNDYEDFGDDPQRLIFALMVQAGRCGNRDFEIVRTELVEDN